MNILHTKYPFYFSCRFSSIRRMRHYIKNIILSNKVIVPLVYLTKHACTHARTHKYRQLDVPWYFCYGRHHGHWDHHQTRPEHCECMPCCGGCCHLLELWLNASDSDAAIPPCGTENIKRCCFLDIIQLTSFIQLMTTID